MEPHTPTAAEEHESQRNLDFKDKVIIILVILMLVLVGYVIVAGQSVKKVSQDTNTLTGRSANNSAKIAEQNDKINAVADKINNIAERQACASDNETAWELAVGNLLVVGVNTQDDAAREALAKIAEATKRLQDAKRLCVLDTTTTTGG